MVPGNVESQGVVVRVDDEGTNVVVRVSDGSHGCSGKRMITETMPVCVERLVFTSTVDCRRLRVNATEHPQ